MPQLIIQSTTTTTITNNTNNSNHKKYDPNSNNSNNKNNNNVASLNEVGNSDLRMGRWVGFGNLLGDVGGDQPGYVAKVFVP